MSRSRFIAGAIVLSIFVPGVVQAQQPQPRLGPLIKATSIVPGCSNDKPILTITLDSLTASYYGNTGLFYHFDSPSTGQNYGGNPVVVPIPSAFAAGSNHQLFIATSGAMTAWPPSGMSSSELFNFTVPSCRKGMTWRLISTNVPTGTIRVGCGTSGNQNECNPYQGDAACTTALPLLCIKKSGSGFPLPVPISVDNTKPNNRWSGGVVGTTAATVPPTTLTGPNGANAVCEKQFGPDWRVAQFHDGAGWYFQAYGGVGDPTKRFWVHIKDQPGICWTP